MIDDLQVDQNALQLQMEQDVIDEESIARKQEEAQAAEEREAAINEATKAEDKPSVAGEITNAIGGGLAGAVEDVWTLPERIYDMASGEMQEQGEDYRPDSAFITEDMFETKTVWGSILKEITNVATMFIPVGGAAKALGLGGKLATAANKGNKVAKLVNNPLAKGALKGAAVDTVLQSSQEANASAMLRDTFGWIDTPLATKDTDHPAMKTLKNVVEGMGIGAVVDGAFYLVKGAGAGADVAKRNKSVEVQTKDMAKSTPPEVPNAYRDKTIGISNRTQANPMSAEPPSKITKELDRIDNSWDGEYGSVDSVLTAREVDRMATGSGESTKVIRDVVERYMKNDSAVRKELADVKAGRKKLSDIKTDAVKRFQETIGNSRDLEELDVDEIIANAPKDVIDGVSIVDPETVMVYDMIIGSLGKQVRDLGIAAREVKNYTDITESGGVIDQLKGKMSALMVATKRARYMSGINLKRYDVGGKPPKRVEVKANLKDIEDTTRGKIEQIFSHFEDDPNGEMFEAVIEAMSMSNKINGIKDFNAFMSARLKGGDFGGRKEQGLLVRELGNVMVHSILSGPKTPVRAALGTGFAGSTRMVSQALGAMLRLPMTGDVATAKASAASVGAMVQTIPEAFSVFKTKLNGYWSGKLATPGTRFSEYNLADENWKAYGQWAESNGTSGDKAAYNIANMAREMNNNKFLTYSTKLMAATDDAWKVIMGRARAREQAVRFVLDNKKNGVTLSATDARAAEDMFYNGLLDAEGNIDINSDTFLKSMYKEATLTEDLSGFAQGLENAFNKAPYLKPFFLFARTGVNGMALGAKNTPLVNLVLDKQRAILTGSPKNLDALRKYGINSAEELANEKALMVGRQAIGAAVVFTGAQMWLNGRLRGNGPVDRQQRKVWTDAGWRRSEVKLGDVWVNFDALEPWSQVLNIIADIGDASTLMGDQWTENKLRTVAAVISEGITSKSYLQGLQQLVDLGSGEPYQVQRIIGNLANNTVPLAGIRNEIGKLINPQMRELSSNIGDAVRNRNLLTESMAGDGALPMKYDILNGKPIRDWDAPTRLWNSISPVSMNFEDGPGRELLFNSNFDAAQSLKSIDGISLREHPRIRSEWQRLIGEQNLEQKLNRLSMRKDVRASVEKMKKDAQNPEQAGNDPMSSYVHNKLIADMFETAKTRAKAKLMQMPEMQQLIQEQTKKKVDQRKSLKETQAVQGLVQLQNK